MVDLHASRMAHVTSAWDIARAIEERRLSTEFLIRDRLEYAAAREGRLNIWAHLGGRDVVTLAKQFDNGPRCGPLHGMPIGIKDLSDTSDMPTSYGSPAYANHCPQTDAAIVALARNAGAVVIGKTATVEFGATKPTATRNPRNEAHTPGGSSAGSAAAVADEQVLFATGTQAGGSVIRPAAYCGVVGFKPTLGTLPLAGTKGYAWTLDTMGLFAQTASDAWLFFAALLGIRQINELPGKTGPLSVGLLFGPHANLAQPCAIEALETVARCFERNNASVRDVITLAALERAAPCQRTISKYEMGRSMLPEMRERWEDLGPQMQREIEAGLAVPFEEYVAALQTRDELVIQAARAIEPYDILITLAADGEAPKGLESTGTAIFASPWTLLGLPAISIPVGTGPAGLPLAVQLIGKRHRDRKLLTIADALQVLLRKHH